MQTLGTEPVAGLSLEIPEGNMMQTCPRGLLVCLLKMLLNTAVPRSTL